jgi:hypothetical protein
VAIGWVAVTEFELSVGNTSIGVSLFFIGGRFGAVGGASWWIGCPKGWAFNDCTGAPAGSNGAPEMALSTALRALSTEVMPSGDG